MIEKLNGTTETVDFTLASNIRLYHNNSAEDFPLHWHVPGEIICPIQNTYNVTVADEILYLKPHDILFIGSGELHSITAPKEGERYILNWLHAQRIQKIGAWFFCAARIMGTEQATSLFVRPPLEGFAQKFL